MNVVQIVQVSGKLKAQVLGTDLYTRFPKNIREEGKFFLVDEVVSLGSHMNVKGKIQPLESSSEWEKAVFKDPSLIDHVPKNLLSVNLAIQLLQKTKDKDLYEDIPQVSHLSSNKEALSFLLRKKAINDQL